MAVLEHQLLANILDKTKATTTSETAITTIETGIETETGTEIEIGTGILTVATETLMTEMKDETVI